MKIKKNMDLKNKKVLVVGIGLSGNSCLRLLNHKGAICDAYDAKENPVIDENIKIRNTFFGGKEVDFERCDYDLIVCSPGVPTKKGILKQAKDFGLMVIGELELAYNFAKGKFIGITGTNGKTTTTTWVHDVFKQAGLKAHLAGNVGIPLSDVVLEHDSEDDIYICELSSYQLESIINFKPIIATILNITPDHLARHGTMEEYAKAKYGIAKNMDVNGKLILNIDDEKLNDYAKNMTNNSVELLTFSKRNNNSTVNLNKYDIKIGLKGEHNYENALAVFTIAKTYGIDEAVIFSSLRNFKGVAHRNEYVDTINGVAFYNDSKATNPEASIPALKSIEEPIVLIAGGMDKGNDYSKWIDYFTNVKFVCLFGETKYDIAKAMDKKSFANYLIFENLEGAFQLACEKANKGDVILLSPACASWDMYQSFEKRGEHFKRLVKELK